MLSDTAIHEAGLRLANAAHAPLKVILFGSYARGDGVLSARLHEFRGLVR
jgi:hypothetical protein